MKRVMVIAGGTWQVPLIKRIKSLGYEVVNSNLYEDSIGFQYSDFSAVSDVRDKDRNLKIARQYKVDAVLTDQSDIAVPTVAYVAEQTGCNTIGSSMAELFTNKYAMREFCQKEGFAVPEYKLCRNKEEAKEFFESLGSKMIIKPLDSQSSRGVFTIQKIEDLDNTFEEAQQYSSNGQYVLAERYVEGTEFTIDGIMENNKHHSLAISEKSHFEYNLNIASRLFFSYENEKFDYDKLRAINDSLVERTGLKFGLTHAEYKYENGKFYLIEMAARGGGTKISSDIVPYVSGIDNYAVLIKNALGDKSDTDFSSISKYKQRCAVLEFLDIESNGKKIKKITGVDEILQLEEIRDFGLDFSEGDIVAKAQDDRSRAGYFIVCAENREAAIRTSEKVKQLLKIECE